MTLRLELIKPEFFKHPQADAERPMKILIETGNSLEIKYLRYNSEKSNWRIGSNDNIPQGIVLGGQNKMSMEYRRSNFYKIVEDKK